MFTKITVQSFVLHPVGAMHRLVPVACKFSVNRKFTKRAANKKIFNLSGRLSGKDYLLATQAKNQTNTFALNDKVSIKIRYASTNSNNSNLTAILLQNKIFYNRYYFHYKKNITPDFLYKENIKNMFMIPSVKKISLNITSKNIINDKKHIIAPLALLQIITGYKAKYTSAHKSIATFKIRKNQLIGCKLDLRNIAMYNFLEKLITIILPKVRSFNGINNNCLNSQQDLNIGLSEVLSFPELEKYFEYFSSLKGIDISLVTNIKSNPVNNLNSKRKTIAFLSGFQFPIKK